MMNLIRHLLWLVLVPGCVAAETLERVIDGDSLLLRSGSGVVEIRLAHLDAPEYNQPYGTIAQTELHRLVAGKNLELELIEGDQYHRIVARVHADGVDVNAEMVRRGLAHVRREYQPPAEMVRLEEQAKQQRLGLWADPAPITPWQWRKQQPKSKPDTPETIPKVHCSDRHRYCRDMRSCAEAMAHLHQCGLSRLDGDGDGIPCENLCR